MVVAQDNLINPRLAFLCLKIWDTRGICREYECS